MCVVLIRMAVEFSTELAIGTCLILGILTIAGLARYIAARKEAMQREATDAPGDDDTRQQVPIA